MTKALQLHPREPSLWVYAAAWEFEHNRNAAASRALMQRGLRMCPDSPELWAEYFRMELLYAHMLRARREILGIASLGTTLLRNTLPVSVFATSACGTQRCEGVLCFFSVCNLPGDIALAGSNTRQEAGLTRLARLKACSRTCGGSYAKIGCPPDRAQSVDRLRSSSQSAGETADTEGQTGITVAEEGASQEEADAAVEAVLSGRVAIVAFQQSRKELPKGVSSYAKFLKALEPFTFPGTEKIAEVQAALNWLHFA